MQRLVWIGAAVAFALWSLCAWLGYAMLGWVGDFTASNAGHLTAGTEMADWLVWAAEMIGAAGGTLIVIFWLFGSAVIAVLAFALSRLLGNRERPRTAGQYRVLPPDQR